jgi:hypothetical protein
VGLVFVSGISAVCAASNDSSQVLTLHSDGIVPGWKMEMSPAALSRSIYFIVTGLMRAYAVTVDSDPVPEITCKLLALQGLATVIRIEGAKETLQAVQKAVVSLLSAAMNHPSSLLRHAAVEARNAWFLLD